MTVKKVFGKYEDKLAWIQKSIQENPAALVVCSTEEVPLLAKRGDCFISRNAMISGMEKISPDIALLAGGTDRFLDMIFPQEIFGVKNDGYWYTMPRLVLEDVYMGAVYCYLRNSVPYNRHRVPKRFPEDDYYDLTKEIFNMSQLLSKVLPIEKTEAERKSRLMSSIPNEYWRNILALVVNNSPVTASCIVAIVQGALSALRDFQPSNNIPRGVPADACTIFLLGDDLSTSLGTFALSCALGRPVLATGYLPDAILPRMKDVTCCYDSRTAGDEFIFLSGRHAEFVNLLEHPSVQSLRALPVELPENLEPGEALIYAGGTWKYRDDILPDFILNPPALDTSENNGKKKWLEPYITVVNRGYYKFKRDQIKEKLKRRAQQRRNEIIEEKGEDKSPDNHDDGTQAF